MGIEHPANSIEKMAVSAIGGAKSGALDTQKLPSDPNLARIIDAWPALPEPIRTAILALVGTAAK